RIADRDCIVEVDPRTRVVRKGEDVAGAQSGQPECEAHGVCQLGWGVASAGQGRVRPGRSLRSEFAGRADVSTGSLEKLPGTRSHGHHQVLDLTDPALVTHHPPGLDGERPIVPTV